MGKLFDLIMLDTRNYDRSITTLDWNDDYVAELIDDAGRSLMGSHQENWFYRSLSESQARGAIWRVIGNQIIFSRMNNTAVYGEALNADQWDGYQSNRNRTLNHLYSNNISNTAFLAGDSHANWVSDLVWLDDHPYDQVTGLGAVGVEFAGTAVSSSGYGAGRSIANSSDRAAALVKDNRELQWTEGYYRGYYELHISPDELNARYYGKKKLFIRYDRCANSCAGCPSVATRNPFEIPLANFTVKAGANHLQRNVAGGRVESGALQRGTTVPTNLTLNTQTGTWNVTGFNSMFVTYPVANTSSSA